MFGFIKIDTSGHSLVRSAATLTVKGPGILWVEGRVGRARTTSLSQSSVEDADQCPSDLPDFPQTINLWIVSARLEALHEALGAEIKFGPTSIGNPGSANEEAFVVKGPLIQVDAADMTRSVLRA